MVRCDARGSGARWLHQTPQDSTFVKMVILETRICQDVIRQARMLVRYIAKRTDGASSEKTRARG